MSENKHEHGYVRDILKITVKTVRTQKSRFEFLSECREFHFHLLLLFGSYHYFQQFRFITLVV